MAQLVSLVLIRWIVIYPVGSAIQLLNNRGLANIGDQETILKPGFKEKRRHFFLSIKLDLPIFIDLSIDKSIPIFIDWLLLVFLYVPVSKCHF